MNPWKVIAKEYGDQKIERCLIAVKPGDVTERVAAGLSDHSVELHGGKVSTPIAKRRTGVPLSRRHGG